MSGCEGFTRKVLVVEDQPLTARALGDILGEAGFEARSAVDAPAAMAMIRDFDPDGAVVDIDLGEGPSGLDLFDAMRRVSPALGVVFVTKLTDPRLQGRRLEHEPTVAYLTKDDLVDPATLIAALEAVLVGGASREHRSDLAPHRAVGHLTRTQIEVLTLVAAGLTNEAIARRRGTTVTAVESTIARAMAVLGTPVLPGYNARVLAVRAFLAAGGGITSSAEPLDDPDGSAE